MNMNTLLAANLSALLALMELVVSARPASATDQPKTLYPPTRCTD